MGNHSKKNNPEISVVPENKEVLKRQKDGGMSRGHRNKPERPPSGQGWNRLNHKILVLNYNLKYKIHTHGPRR